MRQNSYLSSRTIRFSCRNGGSRFLVPFFIFAVLVPTPPIRELLTEQILFDPERSPYPRQFGSSKAQSDGVIARRNEFQDKFFLVHSACRWARLCARAFSRAAVGSFSILFTFSRQRENIGPPHSPLSREYSSSRTGDGARVDHHHHRRYHHRTVFYSAARLFRIRSWV